MVLKPLLVSLIVSPSCSMIRVGVSVFAALRPIHGTWARGDTDPPTTQRAPVDGLQAHQLVSTQRGRTAT